MELDPRPDQTTFEIRPIRIVSSVDTTVRCSLLVGLATVNVYGMDVLFPTELLINSLVLRVLFGKKEKWEGSQFPTCKQDIDLPSQLSDPPAECTVFKKKIFQAFL